MKLLFDQNLSHRLVDKLAHDFPDSAHVRNVGLAASPDADIWTHAVANGFVIISKDTDFEQRALLLGQPPKVVWVRLGNCSTADVVALFRLRLVDLQAFDADETAAFLALS